MRLEITFKNTLTYLFCILTIFFSLNDVEAKPVFPGAEGFGSDTKAMYGNNRNPTICIVTNRTNNNGTPKTEFRNGITVKTGSFREMLNFNVDNKLIIFEVSGNINIDRRLYVRNNYVTIAGQTAPSPGVTLKGVTLVVRGHDILIQHLRIRVGDEGGVEPYVRDGLNINIGDGQAPYNVVIDHCSISWAMDENIGINGKGVHDITVSNSIISEPLDKYKPDHSSKNMIIGTGKNISIIKNLFAHSTDRNPYIVYGNGSSVFVANNLIYNPKDFNVIIQVEKGPADICLIGNVVKGGPNSGNSAKNKLPVFWKDPYPGMKVYLENNRTELGVQADKNDWSMVRNASQSYTLEELELIFKHETPPIWPLGYIQHASAEVEDYIISNAGARPEDRDAVDKRMINDVKYRGGKIISSQNEVGGWPTVDQNKIVHSLPKNPHVDDDGDGYTKLEEWIQLKTKIIAINRDVNILPPSNLKLK